MKIKNNNSKGFTMIEILVTLGILAVLSTVVVVLINPTQLIAQTRDAQRVSDVKRIETAIKLAKNSLSETLTDSTAANIVYISLPDTNSNQQCDEYSLPQLVFGWQYRCVASATNLRKVDSTGWIPINFNSVSANPLTTLPVDPINTVTNNNYYAYAKNTVSSSPTAAVKLDSQKYLAGSASIDGGNDTAYYETSPASWINWTPYDWKATTSANNVMKVNSSTGAVIGTYSVGTGPRGVAVDVSGNVVWVTDDGNSGVTKLNGSTGAIIGTYSSGINPQGIAIDASGNIWVTNAGSNNVTKLNGTTGALIGTYGVGTVSEPFGVVIDPSSNVWVTNTNSLTKLNGSTGAVMGNYPVSFIPRGLAADASGNVWITNGNANNSVTKFNGSTGAVIGTYPVGNGPEGIAVDQSGNVWVANANDLAATITKLNGSTGATIGTYSVSGGGNPEGVAVDASGNIWIHHINFWITKLNGSTGAVIGQYNVTSGNSTLSLGDSTGFAYQYFVLGKR